jgi:integrase
VAPDRPGGLPERPVALMTLADGAGLRQGEALRLTVDGVDILRRPLTVDRQLVTMPDRAPDLAPPPKTQASVTFHALRHFSASSLIRHGESVKTVEARLGHAPAAETLAPTATSGPTRTTGPRPPSTQSLSALRTDRGLPLRR